VVAIKNILSVFAQEPLMKHCILIELAQIKLFISTLLKKGVLLQMKSRGSFTLFLIMSFVDAPSESSQVTLQTNSPIYFTKKALVTSLLRILSKIRGHLMNQDRGKLALMENISRD